MADKLSIEAFARLIKDKYPEYGDIDDTTLVNRIVEKYPEYGEKVELKKKEQTIQPPSESLAGKSFLTPQEFEGIGVGRQMTEKAAAPEPTQKELHEVSLAADRKDITHDFNEFQDYTTYKKNVIGNVPSGNSESKLFDAVESEYKKRGGYSPQRKLYDFGVEISKLQSPTDEDYSRIAGEVGLDYAMKDGSPMVVIPGSDQKLYESILSRATPGIDTDKKDPFIKDMIKSLAAGSDATVAGIYEGLGYIGFNLIPGWEYTPEMLRTNAQKLKESSSRNSQGIISSFKDGNTAEAIGKMVLGVTENLPTLSLLATGNIAGATNSTLGAMGYFTSASKLKELEDVDMPTYLKYVSAFNHGMSEIVGEGLGTIPILNTVKASVSKLGKEAAQKELSNLYYNELSRVMSGVTGLTEAPKREFLSEYATQLAQGITDKVTSNPELTWEDIFDQAADAGMIGLGTGLGLNAPVNISEVSGYIKEKLDRLPSRLTIEQKAEALRLISERDKIQSEIETLDPAFQKQSEEDIESINEQLKNIREFVPEVEPQKQKEDAIQIEKSDEIYVREAPGDGQRVVEEDQREGVAGEKVEKSEPGAQVQDVSTPSEDISSARELAVQSANFESFIKDKPPLSEESVTSLKEKYGDIPQEKLYKKLYKDALKESFPKEQQYDEITPDNITEIENELLSLYKDDESLPEIKKHIENVKQAFKEEIPEDASGREYTREDLGQHGQIEPGDARPLGEIFAGRRILNESPSIPVNKQADGIAPNGQPSKLSPDDYKFVRTKDFKNKFGDWQKGKGSVVLDNNGEPLQVYHGASSVYKEGLNPNKTSGGLFFTYNKKYAEDFARYMSAKTGRSPVLYKGFLKINEQDLQSGSQINNLSENSLQQEFIVTDKSQFIESGIERLSGTVPPTQPPTVPPTPPENKKGQEKGQRRLGLKALESSELPEDVKNDIREQGIEYAIRGRAVTIPEAKEIIKAFGNDRDGLKSFIKNPGDETKLDIRVQLAAEFIDSSLKQARKANTISERKSFENDAREIMYSTIMRSTDTAQELQAYRRFNDILNSSPEMIVESAKANVRKNNEKLIEPHRDDIKNAKQIIEGWLNSDEGKKVISDKVKEASKRENRKERGKQKVADALNKLAAMKGIKKNAIPENEMNQSVFDIVLEIADGLLDIGVGTTEELIGKIKEATRQYIRPGDIDKVKDDIIDKSEANSRLTEPKQKTEVKDEDINKIVDRLYKKMLYADKKQLRRLARDYIDMLQKNGNVNDEGFRELYAKAIGGDYIDSKLEQQLQNAAGILIDAKNIGETLEELYKKYKDTKEGTDDYNKLNESVKELEGVYKQKLREARKANGFISEALGDEKTLGSLLSTFIQGNLLTPSSQIVNIVSNATWLPVRYVKTVIARTIDQLSNNAISWLQKGFKESDPRFYEKLERMKNDESVISYIKSSKKYVTGYKEGLMEGLHQLVTGQLPEDVYVRDISRALHPFKALIENYNSLRGKEKINARKFILNSIESTLGVAPEIMFRFLNLGDKPFRRAAEKARLSELADQKGLNGKDRDAFMLFPDEESAEQSRKAGLIATYQQDNAIQDALISMEKRLREKTKNNLSKIDKALWGMINILKKSQMPYVKTPTNIIIETADYAFPEWSFLQGMYHMVHGRKSKASDYFARAVVGLFIKAGIKTLFAAGIFTLGQAGLEDDDDRGVQNIKESEYRNKNAYSFNADALMRWMNGDDPQRQEGDHEWSYKKLGILSTIMMTQAESYRGMTPEEIAASGYYAQVLPSFGALAKSSFEQSFLTGINSGMNAMTNGGYDADRWMLQTARALSSTVIPNTYVTINKHYDEYIREKRERSLKGIEKRKEELKNMFSESLKKDNGLPTKVTVWGEPVKRVPEGEGLMWSLFNITRAREYSSDFGIKLHELYERTGDKSILPGQPSGSIKFSGKNVKLSNDLYEKLQLQTGKMRKIAIEAFVNSDNYDMMSDEQRVFMLNEIYDGMRPVMTGIRKVFIAENFDELTNLYNQQYGTPEK